MNYWPRWIRAIRGKTLTLSMAQMGAYDRLLDYYYEEEAPLPSDVDECCRIAGAVTKQDRADVQKVLAKFFILTTEGYTQERADAELTIGLKKIAVAQSNGKAGGRPKGSRNKPSGLPDGLPDGLPVGNPEGTQSEPATKAPHPQRKPIPSEAVASAAEAAGQGDEPPRGLTARERVYLIGPSIVGEKARPLLGKLSATYGDETLAEVLAEASRLMPLEEPKAWVVAACERRQQPKPATKVQPPGYVNLDDPRPQWALDAGFANRFDAENERCYRHNAHEFADGKRKVAR